jgi:SAM-dependent methyltransferase
VNAAAYLRTGDGTVLPLPRERWFGVPTAEEEGILDRVVPPVLDVGCGPGRHVLALAERGIVALGVEAAPLAAWIASIRGAPVLNRSIFDPVPGAGRWGSALLLDGNIGIGGDPSALLVRLRHLLCPDGRLLIEIEPPGTSTQRFWLRVVSGSEVGPLFPWARVGADRLVELADRTGYVTTEVWSSGGRWFAVLDRRP